MKQVESAIIETMNLDIDQLTPFQGETKTLSKENKEKLKKEIIDTGFSFAFHVWRQDETNFVIDGHQRLEVLNTLRKEGYSIPPITCNFINAKNLEDAKIRVMQAISQYGKLDARGLFNFVGDSFTIPELDSRFDFPDFEFDIRKEKQKKDNDEKKGDNVPETDENEYEVRPGDIWLLGRNKLICGDSTDDHIVETLLGDEKPDIVFTSPPYTDMRDYGGNDLSIDTLINFIKPHYCDTWFINLGLQRKDNIIVRYWDKYIEHAESVGLPLRSWLVWDKSEPGGFATRQAVFPISHEWIFLFSKELPEVKKTEETKHGGEFTRSTVQEKDGSLTHRGGSFISSHKRHDTVFSINANRDASVKHPAKFPVELPLKFIEMLDPALVYEPFLGSGTTLIACEELDRKCYGVEIDPHYCSVIIKRWEDYTGKKAVKENINGDNGQTD